MSDWQNRARKKKTPRKAPTMKLTPETQRAMTNQHAAFRAKFGRDPVATDPLFFDPDADDVRPLTGDRLRAAIIDAATAAGIPEVEAAAALDDVTTPNQG